MRNKREDCVICSKLIERNVAHRRLKERQYVTCSTQCSRILQRVRVYLINKKGEI